MAFKVSSDSSMSKASMFSLHCSIVVAPMMVEATYHREAHQARANWEGVTPGTTGCATYTVSAAKEMRNTNPAASSHPTGFICKDHIFVHCRVDSWREISVLKAREDGEASLLWPFACRVLPAQHPSGKGAPRQQPDVEVGRCTSLRQLTLEAAVHRREAVLYAHGARDAKLVGSRTELTHSKSCLVGQAVRLDLAL